MNVEIVQVKDMEEWERKTRQMELNYDLFIFRKHCEKVDSIKVVRDYEKEQAYEAGIREDRGI